MRRQMRATAVRQRGFTLFELIVTIVIVAVLGALALPSFGNAMRRGRMTTETNDLLGAINAARNEAITRAAPVSICPSADGAACSGDATAWNEGWMVFVDYANPGASVRSSHDRGVPGVVRRQRPHQGRFEVVRRWNAAVDHRLLVHRRLVLPVVVGYQQGRAAI